MVNDETNRPIHAPEEVLATDGPGKYTVYYDASRGYSGALAREIMRDPAVTSVLKRSGKGKFKTNVEQFLFNAIVCRTWERRLRVAEPDAIVQIAVPLGEMFRRATRYRLLHMAHQHIVRILSLAKEAGWVEVHKGVPSFMSEGEGSRVTRVHPIGTFSFLLDKYAHDLGGNVEHHLPSEVIEMKKEVKGRSRRVSYRDTAKTREMRCRVESINQRCRSLDVTITVPSHSDLLMFNALYHVDDPQLQTPPITQQSSDHKGEEGGLYPEPSSESEVVRPAQVGERDPFPHLVKPRGDAPAEIVYVTDHLRPVSRGGDWVWTLDGWALTHVRKFNRNNWDFGGRLYAHYQNIPKVVRPHFRIGGERTVLMDFSALHPVMLYHSRGLECEGDPYDIGLPIDRDSLKQVLNTMINAANAQQLYGSIKARIARKEIDLSGYEPKSVVHSFRRRHSAIVDLLHKDYGIRLQRVDSEIALLVMERVECLGIHDGFIARRSLRVSLEHEMKRAYSEVVGRKIGVKES